MHTASQPKIVKHLDLSRSEIASYSLRRAILSIRDGDKASTFERDCAVEIARRSGAPEPDMHTTIIPWPVLAAVQQRDLNVSPGSAGGFLVQTSVGKYQMINRPTNPLEALGAQVIDGLVGNLTVPRGSSLQASWLPNETSEPAETNNLGAMGNIAMTPKTCGAYLDVSRMLHATAPLVESIVMAELAAAAMEAELRAALAGTGAAGQPTGIINTPGIGTFVGGSLTYAQTREAETDVLGQSANRAGLGFVCAPAIADLLSRRAAFSANESIWQGALARGTVNGNPAISSTAMPAASLLCGDFGRLTIYRWSGGLTIKMNPYQNFAAAISRIAMFHSVDVGVGDPAAFSLATGVT